MPTPNVQVQAVPERLKEAPKQATKEKAPASSRVPLIIVGLVVVAVAGLSIWYLVRGEPLLVQGEVDATRLDIAARVDGRVAEIPVERGQNVAAGAVLVKIDNPETLANNEQAVAAKIVAEAQLANVKVGTRVEVIAARKAELERAQASVVLSATASPRVASPGVTTAQRSLHRLGRVCSRWRLIHRLYWWADHTDRRSHEKECQSEYVRGASLKQRPVKQRRPDRRCILRPDHA
jgi:Biotin-lipoyl like